ncbi:MAG: hypothetical protein ACK57V_05060 [Pirellula sp.]|jgi:hypothetical protein
MPDTLHLNLAEYDAMVLRGAFDMLDRKVELFRGELVEINPAGPLHDYLITYLTNWSVRNCDPSDISLAKFCLQRLHQKPPSTSMNYSTATSRKL